MPFELGLFLGATKFGSRSTKGKAALILDREPYRYQAFLSDIAGQDVHTHGGKIGRLIEEVATWLRDHGNRSNVPGGRAIATEFGRFSTALAAICATRNIEPAELTFLDYWTLASEWIVA
jgi:hypothetical protein